MGRGLRLSFRALLSLCLSQSTRGGFLHSFSKDKKQHINMIVHPVFQEALPIPLSILPVAVAAHTILPQWCQSDTPLLGLLPRGEHAFCRDEKC